MSGYHTEQKKILLAFLEKNTAMAYSIDEIICGIRQEHPELLPGKSTIYRLMTHLVEEGRVKRLVKGNSRHFVYQLLEGGRCHQHLHLKCIRCGTLLHLDEETSDKLLQTVTQANDFAVSERDTVLFGTCKACRSITAHG